MLPNQVVALNRAIASTLADRANAKDIRRDWRLAMRPHEHLFEGFAEFLTTLPPESVDYIQKVANSILDDGGSIAFELGSRTDYIDLVGKNITIAHPDINIIICHCDANFRHCGGGPPK